jgi:hypothetical protein
MQNLESNEDVHGPERFPLIAKAFTKWTLARRAIEKENPSKRLLARLQLLEEEIRKSKSTWATSPKVGARARALHANKELAPMWKKLKAEIAKDLKRA